MSSFPVKVDSERVEHDFKGDVILVLGVSRESQKDQTCKCRMLNIGATFHPATSRGAKATYSSAHVQCWVLCYDYYYDLSSVYRNLERF